MKPQTFNNALVAVVSAYAEALGEQTQLTDGLQQALRETVKRPHARTNGKLEDAARALVEAVDTRTPGDSTPVEAALSALRDELRKP